MRGLEQIIKSNEELSKLKQPPERQPWPFPKERPAPAAPKVNIDPADPEYPPG